MQRCGTETLSSSAAFFAQVQVKFRHVEANFITCRKTSREALLDESNYVFNFIMNIKELVAACDEAEGGLVVELLFKEGTL